MAHRTTWLRSDLSGGDPERAPSEDRERIEPGGSVASPPEPSWSYRPLQSLVGQRSSRRLGLLLPVRSRRSLNVQPFRYSFRRPVPTKRLAGKSSPGVRPSFTACPDVPARRPPGRRAPLLGFRSPTAFREEGVHGSPVGELPGCPGFRRRVPIRRLRCRSQVFSTSQRLLSPSTVLPSFRQVTLLGFGPPGVLIRPRSPDDSSPPACPPDVAPLGWPSPT